jgi:hypothetical protein
MSERVDVSRRGLFQILGSAAVAGAAAGQTHDHAGAEREAAAGTYQRKTFDEREWRTVHVLCDLIIPADERSGSAAQAGVPEFIDDWLDFRKREDGNSNFGAQILGGLAWLDRESQRLFQTGFADSSPERQNQILDRIAWPARAAAEDRPWAAFFSRFRDLTVSGFASSKMGVADLPYLGNRAIAEWKGCDPKVWAIIEERMKNGYKGLGGEVKPWSA